MDTNDFKLLIHPFFWIDHEINCSVCLEVGVYMVNLFRKREDEGFEGNGYDWASLAKVFVEEHMPGLIGMIKFDPEAGMFCAYSSDAEALKTFIVSFKEACENDVMINDLFSKAELD